MLSSANKKEEADGENSSDEELCEYLKEINAFVFPINQMTPPKPTSLQPIESSFKNVKPNPNGSPRSKNSKISLQSPKKNEGETPHKSMMAHIKSGGNAKKIQSEEKPKPKLTLAQKFERPRTLSGKSCMTLSSNSTNETVSSPERNLFTFKSHFPKESSRFCCCVTPTLRVLNDSSFELPSENSSKTSQ